MQAMETRISNKQNPVVFYIRTLLYMLIALMLRVIAFLPLAALFVFQNGWRYLALLCPVLLIFLILPLRFSFAQGLVQQKRERNFSFDKALSLSRYGEKLSESVLHALHVLKWALPLLAFFVGVYFWQADTDWMTLLKSIRELGAGASAVYVAIVNFFVSIFGGTPLVAAGGLMEGFYTLIAIVWLCVFILLYGVVRNSSYRYIWVVASADERNPRTEARRRLRGRRWRQLGVALLNLLLWAPALLVVALTLKDVLSGLGTNAANMLMQKKLLLPDTMAAVKPLLFAFFALYLPLLPIRRFVTCAFATHTARHIVNKTDAVPVTGGVVGIPTTSSGAPSVEAVEDSQNSGFTVQQ